MEAQQTMESTRTPKDANRTMPVAGHLFDEAMHVTDVKEYGVSFEDLVSGRVAPPPQGARFDVFYEGAVEGERLRGFLRGVDYLLVRADGRFQLNIEARLITHDGQPIAVASTALLTPDPVTGLAQVRLNMEFNTASPAYAWVNTIQAWGTGTVNMQTREINVSMYEA